MATTESFPLKWPIGQPRKAAYLRKDAQFKTSMAQARDGLLEELRLMRASNIVLSTNAATYRKGARDIPYANQKALDDDPGAAVYFSWKGEQYALACDQWRKLADNIQAIRKTVEALRGIERWGTGHMMKAAFAGFKALPKPGQTSARPWWDVLAVSQDCSYRELEGAKRRQLKKVHPDVGGSVTAFMEVMNAFDRAIKEKVF